MLEETAPKQDCYKFVACLLGTALIATVITIGYMTIFFANEENNIILSIIVMQALINTALALICGFLYFCMQNDIQKAVKNKRITKAEKFWLYELPFVVCTLYDWLLPFFLFPFFL